ncbi:integrase catalytic domain-containing protein [Nephila pilipes]|uniref:Integrase catalytic domain-containing protein n=1 Tax=Nephila pilipes TaxID=299642 RepID=A0A8X6QNV5_NEPPI|nr:integrase catalytic domain-containing protein [Nephila pilipes]
MWKGKIGHAVELNYYEVVKRCFSSLSCKPNKNREIYEQYKRIISDELKCPIVGKCINKDRDSGYYMPHREVIRDDKGTTRALTLPKCWGYCSGSDNPVDLQQEENLQGRSYSVLSSGHDLSGSLVQFIRRLAVFTPGRLKLKPGTQVVAPLPLDGIQEHPPFDACGLNFAGTFLYTILIQSGIYLRVVCDENNSFRVGS